MKLPWIGLRSIVTFILKNALADKVGWREIVRLLRTVTITAEIMFIISSAKILTRATGFFQTGEPLIHVMHETQNDTYVADCYGLASAAPVSWSVVCRNGWRCRAGPACTIVAKNIRPLTFEPTFWLYRACCQFYRRTYFYSKEHVILHQKKCFASHISITMTNKKIFWLLRISPKLEVFYFVHQL